MWGNDACVAFLGEVYAVRWQEEGWNVQRHGLFCIVYSSCEIYYINILKPLVQQLHSKFHNYNT